jgi:hypothetical protein
MLSFLSLVGLVVFVRETTHGTQCVIFLFINHNSRVIMGILHSCPNLGVVGIIARIKRIS